MFKESDLSRLQQSLEVFNTEFRSGIATKLPSVSQMSRQRSIGQLTQHLQKGKLVLVLGAGASTDFKLPGWDALLQKLLLDSIDHNPQIASILSQLFVHLFSPSPLIAGRYLQRSFEGEKMSFNEVVRSALYTDANLNATSALMGEITKLCQQDQQQRINSVVTYNYDDILEQHLKKAKIKHRTIFGTEISNEGDGLNIYHVHGYLPRKGKLQQKHEITLGEDLYHQQYNDIYSWKNIIQIDKFREQHCLFIGVSLTDPNLRRLLDIATLLRGKKRMYSHYLLKKRYEKEVIKSQLMHLLENNQAIVRRKAGAQLNVDDTVTYLVKIIERFDEKDAQSFGVKILWLDDFDEIPELLAKLQLPIAE